MSAVYKPGTVAVATVRGVPNVRVFRNGGGWWSVAERGPQDETLAYDHHVTDVRPLVVLDLPNPALMADRLRKVCVGDGGSGARIDAVRDLADQIEAQTRPPKPPEPTGLGAVVEDERGVHHVRVYSAMGGMTAWLGHVEDDGGERTRRWTDIAAVRVLSEGVPSC